MHYDTFIDSLQDNSCPAGLDPCLQALWHDARGDWDRAHRMVQAINSPMAARIHAYLHRKDGDAGNARYWHRQAGSTFPAELSLAAEWDMLVRELAQ